MKMNLLLIGYFAVFCTVVSFLPQAIKTLKTREVNGLSALTYLFLFLGSLSWFSYGILLSDVPLVVTNFLTTFFTGLILFLIVKEKSKTN
jgi:MtN3 and saliva related transmembrane protein